MAHLLGSGVSTRNAHAFVQDLTGMSPPSPVGVEEGLQPTLVSTHPSMAPDHLSLSAVSTELTRQLVSHNAQHNL